MLKKWQDIKHKTTPEQRASALAKAEEMLEKMHLHELRKARRQTQKDLATSSGIAQSEISRIETRKNITLGTLDTYVRGLGGALEVRAVFPEKTIAIEIPREGQQPTESAA